MINSPYIKKITTVLKKPKKPTLKDVFPSKKSNKPKRKK
jgi:preprotein translocase subunit Sss1